MAKASAPRSRIEFKLKRTVLLALGLAFSLTILALVLQTLNAKNAERKTVALYTALKLGDYAKVQSVVHPETVAQLRGLENKLGKVRSFEWLGAGAGVTPPYYGRVQVERAGQPHLEDAMIDSSGDVYLILVRHDRRVPGRR